MSYALVAAASFLAGTLLAMVFCERTDAGRSFWWPLAVPLVPAFWVMDFIYLRRNRP